MFRKLNTKHGNERPRKLQYLRTNKALAKHDLKTKNWSHLEREQTVKGGKERRREEEEEEEKRKKEESSQGMELWIFGMETTLGMDFVWITWNFKVLYG